MLAKIPMIHNWERLNEENNPIVNRVRAEWDALLCDKTCKERHYQRFIAEHAGFLFSPEWHSALILSKIRLGSEYEVDFVIPHDRASLGLTYELIEIESPHSTPYTKHGDPSARLTHAVQQVQNWMVWLNANPGQAKRIFPATTLGDSPSLTYTVVMGTRDNSRNWLDRRNEFGKQTNILIRSFDWFSDLLQKHLFEVFGPSSQTEFNKLTPEVSNALVNPFCKALTHQQWTEFNRRTVLSGHGIADNADLIVETRKLNRLFDEFVKMENQ